MIIIPNLVPRQVLILDAYSSEPAEIEALESTLRRFQMRFTIEPLPFDSMNRRGVRHTIFHADIPALEKNLEIEFHGQGDNTRVLFTGASGTGFRCKEIASRGGATGCVNLAARDQSDATVKCAMLARQNGWFGGEAQPGDCGRWTR